MRDCLIPHFVDLTVFVSIRADQPGAASKSHTSASPGPGLHRGRHSSGERSGTGGSSSIAASDRAMVGSFGGAATVASAARCSGTRRHCGPGTYPARSPTPVIRGRFRLVQHPVTPRRGPGSSAGPPPAAGRVAATNARPSPYATPDAVRPPRVACASGPESSGSSGR
jgi:hypothetical protein